MIKAESKRERWTKLSSELLGVDDHNVQREVKHILDKDTSLLATLNNLVSERSLSDFFQVYSAVSRDIPVEWFVSSPDNQHHIDHFKCFDNLHSLASLTVNARRKIWIDVPRTFGAFTSDQNHFFHFSAHLSSPRQLAEMLAVLCRTLSASSHFLNGQYCQGMAFLAASYILYCKTFGVATLSEEKETAKEGSEDKCDDDAYAAAVYHFIMLKKHMIAPLYTEEKELSEYIEAFEFQLSSSSSASLVKSKNEKVRSKLSSLYRHFQLHNVSVNFFALQWFGSCFVLNLSEEMLIVLQEVFIYGRGGTHAGDVMTRMGMTVLYLLADELLTLDGFEEVIVHMQMKMKEISPLDVVRHMFSFELKKPSVRKKMSSSTYFQRKEHVPTEDVVSSAVCTCVVA